MKTRFIDCTILTEPGAHLQEHCYLETEGPYISALGALADAPPTTGETRIVESSGKLLMPGLINGHNHCAMTLFRGLADDLDLKTWLHDHIFPAEKQAVTREMVYWCSRLAAAEMILSGTTCVADAYFFSGESARALADCGLRGVVAHGIVDFPAPSVPDPKDNIAAVADFLATWQDAHPLITPGVFAHSPYTCSPTTLHRAKDLADQHNVRFFTHLAESRQEMEMIIDPHGTTPLTHLAQLNLLDSNTVLVHGVWLDDKDIALLAESGASLISCPQSNLKLGSGIAPLVSFLDQGGKVGLGTDGCASNNSLDLFREMAVLAKLHKLSTLNATALSATQALRCATVANSEILNLPQCGRIGPGMLADFILLDLQQPHLTPLYNSDFLVYAATGADVDTVMIHGEVVMEDRTLLSFDLEETLSMVNQLAHMLFK